MRGCMFVQLVCLSQSRCLKRQERQSSKSTSSNNRKSRENSDEFLLNSASFRFCPAISTLFRQGFFLEFADLKYFSLILSLYYLATESNSADTKHTTTHHLALSFTYNVTACTYVFVKFLWNFENLIHRQDDLQLHALHFASFFKSFPCRRKQANNNKGLEKGFSLVTHRNFPPDPFLRANIFFISRCHEKELIAVFKLPTWNVRE